MIKRCCANCIDDRHIKNQLIPQLSTHVGICSYCRSKDVRLIEPAALREQFALVIGVYKLDETGKTLCEWLKDDWAMFAHPSMDLAHSKDLVADILDDGDIVRKNFSPYEKTKSQAIANWNELRFELKHGNRFFPKSSIDLDRLGGLFEFLLLDQQDVPRTWYRARRLLDGTAYDAAAMGSPPMHLASHGRANPAGIPYLYLASNIQTAISEVRPHTGENVCVAEFVVPDGLKIADLRHPRKTVSPFILADEQEVALLRGDIEFLDLLGEELTRPVLPHSAAFDYIPSQFLCEFVKNCGFDGVMYKSSVEDGHNVALFRPDTAIVNEITTHSVRKVTVLVNY